jgi:FtsP/CotA-like multicopper oxidase with cupredoxin domain
MKTANKRTAVGMAVAMALIGSTVQAAEVWLQAREMTFQPAEPGAAAVPMWGYVQCTAGFASCAPQTATWAPGPVLSVPVGESSLIVHLQNQLPVATSLSVSGLRSSAVLPTRTSSSAPLSALTSLEAPAGGTADYTFTNLRSGTFLYQSASDPRVQVQMGLYGAVAVAYPAATFTGPNSAVDDVLLFSEIDPALHTTPTAAGMRNYAPRYFLINGKPDGAGAATGPAADTGFTKRLRLLNAGLTDRIPQLLGEYFRIESQDGLAVPAAQRHPQYNTLLPAGATLDVGVTALAPGVFPLYDRKLGLVNGSQPGGMRTALTVSGALPPPQTAPDSYNLLTGSTLVVNAPGVLGNDSPIATGAALSGAALAGLTFNSNGSFTYVAPATPGTQTFQYVASNTAGSSAPQTVTLNVTAANRAPVGAPDFFYINSNTTSAQATQTFASPGVLAGDTDPDGDTLRVAPGSVSALTGGNSGAVLAVDTTTAATRGQVSLTFGRTWVGDASFTYRAQDTAAVPLDSGPTTAHIVRDFRISSITNTLGVINVTGVQRALPAAVTYELLPVGACQRAGTVVDSSTVSANSTALGNLNFIANAQTLRWNSNAAGQGGLAGCSSFIVRIQGNVPATGSVPAHPAASTVSVGFVSP